MPSLLLLVSNTKILPGLVLATAMVACLGGCGGTGTSTPQGPTVPTPQPAADYRDVAYTTVPRRIALDLYTPAGTPPFPVVVWIHGGSWVSGVRDIFPGHPALRLRDRGYAVATIDYRLVPEAFFPAQAHDCKAALRWLRGNAERYGLDRNRIAAWGASAGGHLAALVGTSGGMSALEDLAQGNPAESSRVQAVVDWFGPTDYRLADADQQLTAALLLGCPIAACPDKAVLASPVSHVDGSDPLFLIQHGTADRVVPIEHSERLHGELLAAAVRSTFTRLDGAGHATIEFLTAENLARIDAFLDAELRGR